MKYLITTLLIIYFNLSSAQSSYFSVYGGITFKEDANKPAGGISVGQYLDKDKTNGIGMGIGVLDYDKPYIPITLDFSYFGTAGKVTPMLIMRAGYGVYNYSNTYVRIRGGFAGNISAGVSAPVKGRSKLFVSAAYYYNSFSTIIQRSKNVTYDERFAAIIGIKL